MPHYLTEKAKTTWAFSKEFTEEENIAAALTKLACFRQARMDPVSLKLYAEALVGCDLRAFQAACEMLKNTPRQEGETAIPDFGTILDAIEECREKFPVFSKGAKEIDTTPIFDEPRKLRLS